MPRDTQSKSCKKSLTKKEEAARLRKKQNESSDSDFSNDESDEYARKT
jgi:hypothetical protein